MSQDQTLVNSSLNPDPGQDRAPSLNRDTPLALEFQLNHSSAAPPGKDSVAANNPGSSDTAVASTVAVTLKRPREKNPAEETGERIAVGEAPPSKRRVRATTDLIYRIVVPSRQIGKVIGRSGHRIQKIREDSKAAIKIADAISLLLQKQGLCILSEFGFSPVWQRQEERVIIINSEDSDNIFSNAENALHQIVSLLLKDDEGNVETLKVGAGHVAVNTVRLLIAGSQAGGLIGVSGQNIVNLRNTSGAVITVLSSDQLPPCASAHEYDRVVQISGEIPAVLRAVVEIGCQLRDNPPKQVISVNPTNNNGFGWQSQQCADPNSASHVTLDVMVPENLVGGLIGRFGANISRIRNESGANIKVYGGRGEQTQRQIHLGGNAQQVALAKQRVDEYVYAELMRQAGGRVQETGTNVSNALYQAYAHPHTLYTTSTQGTGLIPQMGAINQPPPYYTPLSSYKAPQPQ